MDQKSSFFICPRVSARFLHCFCTVSRDAMGTLTCRIRQRMQKLPGGKSRCFAQKQRKLVTSKIRVFYPVGSFNQRTRDLSSLERAKIPRRIARFLVGFSIFWSSAHFCTPAGKPCFSLHCLHSVHREPSLSGQSPSILLRKTALSLKSSTGAFIAALRSQTRTCRDRGSASRRMCRSSALTIRWQAGKTFPP